MDAAYAAVVFYGRGGDHAASLNFGDLFSYALDNVRGVPLPFEGDDIARTFIQPAWPAS
jgi:ribonuclease VapC